MNGTMGNQRNYLHAVVKLAELKRFGVHCRLKGLSVNEQLRLLLRLLLLLICQCRNFFIKF